MTERNKHKIELISAICIPSYKPAKARSCPCGDQLLPNQPLYPACFTPAVGIEKCDNATWVCWDLQLKHKPSTFMSYRVSNSLTEGQFAFQKTFSSTLFHNNKIEEKVCQVILQYCFCSIATIEDKLRESISRVTSLDFTSQPAIKLLTWFQWQFCMPERDFINLLCLNFGVCCSVCHF